MKSPQKENGYTPIANEILEVISKCKLNGTQFRILTVVWRYTYGFSRKEHELGVNFLVNATGISKRQIQKELNELMSSKILIEVRPASFNSTRIISFNKNYDEWKLDTSTPNKQQVNEKGGDEQKDTSTGELLNTSTGDKKDTSTGELLDTQERNIKTIYKTNIKQEEEEAKKNVVEYYESVFGMLNTFQMTKIWEWAEDFKNDQVIKMAIDETALKNPRYHFNYFENVLKDWYKRKLFTVDLVIREKEKHEQQINQQYKSKKEKSLFEQGEESKRRQAEAEANYKPRQLTPEEQAEEDELLPY